MTKKLATYPNTYVISFFDCCRKVVQTKGISSPSDDANAPTDGQRFTIYAAEPTATAGSFRSSELSLATEAFLKHMQSDAVMPIFEAES